jgi:hypothetical protein
LLAFFGFAWILFCCVDRAFLKLKHKRQQNLAGVTPENTVTPIFRSHCQYFPSSNTSPEKKLNFIWHQNFHL